MESVYEKHGHWKNNYGDKTNNPKRKRLGKSVGINNKKKNKVESAKICQCFQRENVLLFVVCKYPIYECEYEQTNNYRN